MHGLIFSSFQSFVCATYGDARWAVILRQAGCEVSRFEPMLHYDTGLIEGILSAAQEILDKPRDALLEDLGTFLVTHPSTSGIRRLLRFGGADFTDFLHSLDDLPERARLAIPDLDMPKLMLSEFNDNTFQLTCQSVHSFFGPVFVGLLRAIADDYGALVFLEQLGRDGQADMISVAVIKQAFAAGKGFRLAAGVADRRCAQ